MLEWSVERFESLRSLFGVADDEPLWKGRLAIFVLEDRAGYEHFNEIVTHRRIFPETFGNSQVIDTFADAFIVLEDVGDEPTAGSPTLQFSLSEQLTAAYLAPSLNSFPEWLSLGLGPGIGRHRRRPQRRIHPRIARFRPGVAGRTRATDGRLSRRGVLFCGQDATRRFYACRLSVETRGAT